MKTRIILGAFVALCVLFLTGEKAVAQSQGYIYTYDKNGNRTSRTYSATVFLKQGATAETKSAAGETPISIFPNPTKGILTVSVGNMPSGASAALTVFDINGNQVARTDSKSRESEIDLSGFADGAYFLTVSVGAKSETFKIVKE